MWVGRGRKTAVVALLQCPRLDYRIEFEGKHYVGESVFCQYILNKC